MARGHRRIARTALTAVVTLLSLSLTGVASAAPAPTVTAGLTFNEVTGSGFAPGAQVMVTVYTSFGGTVLWSGTTPTSGGGDFRLEGWMHGQDLVPGNVVQVTDGDAAKALTLRAVAVGPVDRAADTVSGSAPPGSLVHVDVSSPPFGGTMLDVTADGGGSWTADFTGLYDITMATWVSASVADTDGDRTRSDRPPPQVQANLTFDNVNASGFAPDTDLAVTIGAYSGTAHSDAVGIVWIDRSQHGQDLVPGMTVSVSDGTDTKTLTLAALAVTSIDPGTDTVSGTAPAGAQVGVGVFTPPGGGGTGTGVTADGGGNWSADFTGQFDVTLLSHANASISDDDGDQTQADKELARIQANMTSDWLSGSWFAADTPVSLSLGGTPSTATTDGNGNFWADRDQLGADLVAGMTVSADDGAVTKTLTLDEDLAISTVDAMADVISGTAAAGATVQVDVNKQGTPEGSTLTVTADGSGSWSADFHGQFEVTGGTNVSARVTDADGDASIVDRQGATVQADVANDWIGGNWFAPDANVTVTIYDEPGGAELYTGTAPTDAWGNFAVGPDEHGRNLAEGMYVTVDDGATAKDVALVHLTIDVVDVDADVVSGTAPGGAMVGVGASDNAGNGAWRSVTADGSGQWSADFTGEFDVDAGSGVNAGVNDDDGDATTSSHSPAEIEVNLTDDNVGGNNFAPNTTVTVTVDDTPRASAETDAYGNFWTESVGVDLVPGSVVVASDGSTSKELTLVALTIDTVDPATDVVTGTAPADAAVAVHIDESGMGGGDLEVTADGSGHWSADFTGTFDVPAVWFAWASVRDSDGDRTAAPRQSPTVNATLSWDDVSGEGFAPSSAVTVSIHQTPGGTLLWSGSVPTDSGGRFGAQQQDHQQDLVPGMQVVVDDGVVTKELVLADVSIGIVDRLADTVSGGAPTGSTVYVDLWDRFAGQSFTTTAGAGNTWTLDAGGMYDIAGGTDVQAAVRDDDGDTTSANRQPPRIDANLSYDSVSGEGFAPNGTVTVTIWQAPGGTELYSGTTPTWDDGSYWIDREQHTVDLEPGMQIAVTDGTDTKDLTLVPFEVVSVDPANDVVSGTGPAGEQVFVDVWDRNDEGWQSVTADGSGDWSADFAGTLDLTSSAHASASVQDADRDQTMADRSAPSLTGNLTADSVHGEGFEGNGSVTVTIGTTDTVVPTNGDGSFDFDPGSDLVAGVTIGATDGTTTRSLTLAAVTVDAIDAAADTVSGTAPSGTEVLVGVSHPWEGNEMTVTAVDGSWTADFAGQWDVTAADTASAQVSDTDGDRTVAQKFPAAVVLDGTTLTITSDQAVTVRRSGNAIQVTGDGIEPFSGATVYQVDLIQRFGDPTVPFTIDLTGGPFAPGATSEGGKASEIEFDVAGALVIQANGRADVMTVGALGINLTSDADVDVTGDWGSVTIDGGGGNDSLSAAGSAVTGAAYTNPVVLRGGTGDDVLTGGPAGDTLQGGPGADTLSGRGGANSLDGGVDVDRADYAWSPGGVSVDLGTGAATGSAFTDTLAGIENVTGSAFADVLVGNLAANVLDGAAGNDSLDIRDGISGNDTGIGGSGTDTCLADPRDRKRGVEG